MRSLFPMVALTVVLAACAEPVSTALAPEEVAFAKPGTSGSTDTDPRARWTFYATHADGSTLTRIYGDGRTVDGEPTAGPSEYQGDVCGVHAKIFVANGGGDAVIDPDKGYKNASTCPGGARVLRFDLEGSVITAGAFTNARGVYHLTTEGAYRDQDMSFTYTNIPHCESLRFETAAGSGVRVTRLNGASPGQWRVETLGSHVGLCYNYVKGKYVHRDGVDPKFVLPFHAVVTEVSSGTS